MRRITLTFALIGIAAFAHAQDIVKWKFSAVKLQENVYELHFTPTVNKGWHIYSQYSPEGGPVPTTFTFNKHPLITSEGKVKENGKLVSKYEEVFGVTVKYFEGQVDFVQKVKLKTKAITTISGQVEFMACNDEQCTLPATVNFSIRLE